ncbi:MAG: carboxypeptidase regulatory-like domain-containing protein [Planctomycetes bacterium]|nr:carboxypeptidase regulatory-like domain-containing protein [Planctomycetota bacterium]
MLLATRIGLLSAVAVATGVAGVLYLTRTPADPPAGTLVVQVTDMDTKGPVPGSRVKITFPGQAEAQREALTDDRGEVAFASLPGQYGKFDVYASKEGYQPSDRQEVDVLFDKSLTVPVKLRPLGVVSERVTFHVFTGADAKGQVALSFHQPLRETSPEDAAGVMANEELTYRGTRWVLAGDGREIKAPTSKLPGYRIAENVPTRHQLCGGLAFSQVFGGPYVVPTNQAWAVVSAFGAKVTGPKRVGDVVVWSVGTEIKHFAWVSELAAAGNVFVLSKDNAERVYEGFLHTFPKTSATLTDLDPNRADNQYGRPEVYRLDWDSLHCYREGDPAVLLPAAAGKADWGSKDAIAPRPRVQKVLLEAANEATRALGLPEYRVSRTGDNAWQAEWTVRAKDGSLAAACRMTVAAERSVEAARAVVAQQGEVWTKVGIGPPPAGAIRHPVKPLTVAGEAGAQTGASKFDNDFLEAGACVWSCGTYVLRVAVDVGPVVRGVEKDSDKWQMMKWVAQHTPKMQEILASKAAGGGLNLPERPAAFPGRHKK